MGKLGNLLRGWWPVSRGEGQVLADVCVGVPSRGLSWHSFGLSQITMIGGNCWCSVCRAQGSLLCRSTAGSLLGFLTGDKPDRCDLSLESNLNTWF